MTQQITPEAQARAEAKLTKQQERARESELALAAYHAENRAVEEKTARLRAARLAKEAKELAQAKVQAVAPEAVETSPRDAAAAFIAKRRTLKTPTAKAAPKPRAKKKTAH